MRRILLLLLTLLTLSACGTKTTETSVIPQELQLDMQHRLYQEEQSEESRFYLIMSLVNHMEEQEEWEEITTLLNSHLSRNPEDYYNGYYLYLLGMSYEKMGAPQFTRYYYRQALKNHPDMEIDGKSLHQTFLEYLSPREKNPYVRREYYEEMNLRFDLTSDPGRTAYYLAQTLEELGEWDLATKTYSTFLRYPDTVIYGQPLAHKRIREKVAFYYSDKNWTRENLDDLIYIIKNAIWRRDIWTLDSYRSKVNFFAQTWEHKDTLLGHDPDFVARDFLQEFLNKSRLSSGYSTVRFARDLDVDSNKKEAYLRSEGWYYRIPIWYLYFQRVDYPKDPEMNGRWEWTGIYFGEKL